MSAFHSNFKEKGQCSTASATARGGRDWRFLLLLEQGAPWRPEDGLDYCMDAVAPPLARIPAPAGPARSHAVVGVAGKASGVRAVS